ncbi:MAG: right-handed parallel beta-helix repeat-containing protein [Campylobacterales bacterium]|nr:right-handed parallel beta-helix repeat-containing protein [Campylobacterales bacterium]
MRSALFSTLLVALVLFVVTGCSLKKAEPVKPESVAKVQPPMKKLEYFGSDAVAVNIPPKSLEEEMGEAPSAVGEFQPVLSPEEAAAQITQYALQAKDGNRSLPLFGHWDTGARSDVEGMSPDFMLSLVEQGHHALVAWELDPYWARYIPMEYYERSIKRAAELKLPLVLVAGSFALPLIEDAAYAKQKGILINGALSPKGATKTWQAAGKKWMSSELMKQLQEWYPNPPLVVFLSRSEEPRASAASAGLSNKQYGDAWFERYRALHTGMKSGLSSAWSQNAIFVGRNTFANQDIGKTDDWMAQDETTTEGTLSAWPLIFDGASVDFVLGSGEDDTSLNSPHASANSLPFLLEDTKFLNNDFWWEATIGAPSIAGDAERYRGFAQFDLWLNRPSIVREVAAENEDNASVMEHFVQLIDSVEMVHKSDILKDFWENGTLVKNPNVTNPHDKNIPEMYRGELGWYMLDTDAQGVWAFALVKGEEPNREWLVFVQSAMETLPEELHVSIPDYQDVAVSVVKSGEFFVVEELISSSNILEINSAQNIGDTQNTIQGNGRLYFLDFLNGDNNNDGSISHPFKDIEKVVKILLPGDTLNIREGEYLINKPLFIGQKDSSKNPEDRITVQAYNNEHVIINGQNLATNKKQNIIDLWGRKYITIKNITIKNSTYAGINITNASYVSVINCVIEYTAISAIFISASNVTIEGNECKYNNYIGDQEAISISKSTEILVKDNNVHHNGNVNNHNNGIGIDVKDGGSNIIITGNNVHHMATDGIYLDARGWLSNIEISNNIVTYCGNRGIKIANETPIGGSENIYVYNNISAYNKDGIVIGQDRMPPNTIKNAYILNNVAYKNTRDGIVVGTKMSDNVNDEKPKNIVIANNIISENENKAIAMYGNVEKEPYTIDTNIIDGASDWLGINVRNIKPNFIDTKNMNFITEDIIEGTNKYFAPISSRQKLRTTKSIPIGLYK